LPDYLVSNGFPTNLEDFMAYDYENEEPTDEARTNEDAYDEIHQQMAATKYGEFIPKKSKGTVGNCVFFSQGKDNEHESGDDYSSE